VVYIALIAIVLSASPVRRAAVRGFYPKLNMNAIGSIAVTRKSLPALHAAAMGLIIPEDSRPMGRRMKQ
jgi:hypothetical protein